MRGLQSRHVRRRGDLTHDLHPDKPEGGTEMKRTDIKAGDRITVSAVVESEGHDDQHVMVRIGRTPVQVSISALIAAKPGMTGRATRVFTWDYREQPPLGEILAEVRKMAAPWFWFCPETGTQEYTLILSDRELTADEAERILWESVEG